MVCTSSSACRVTMGHWGQCHHIPEMARHCMATLGGHTHTSTTTFGVADAPYSTVGSNCAAPCSGVKRWCACHPQHVGSPWGNGGNVTTSQGWQGTAWSPWVGGTHTPYSTVGSNCAAPFGCLTVVCTSSSARGAQWCIALHNCTAKATHPRTGRTLLGHLGGPHTHHTCTPLPQS